MLVQKRAHNRNVGMEASIKAGTMSMFPHPTRLGCAAFEPFRRNHCQRFVFSVIIKVMKRLVALVVFWCLAMAPEVRAESQDEQYVGIYNLIQQADSLNES